MACGTEDNIDRFAIRSGEVISFEETILLHMADDRLYGISPSPFAPNGG